MPKFTEHDCHLTKREENIVQQLIDTGIFIEFRRKIRSWCMINKKHPETSRYFKSNAACRNEEIRHLIHYYRMIHPFSLFSLYWEFFFFCIFTGQQLLIAIDSAFENATEKHVLFLCRLFWNVLQVADISKLFFTGYYDYVKSKTTLDFHRIARKYTLTYFFFDISSCFYTFSDFLMWQGVFVMPYAMKVVFLIFCRFKICRLPRCLRIMELFRQYMGFSSHLFKAIKLIYIFMVMILWSFSVHFFVEEQTSVYLKANYTRGEEAERNSIYESYYDATLLLLLISFGKENLEVLLEYVNVIFFLCFGMGLQLFVFAQILQVWTKYQSSENKHHSLHTQFKEYVQYKELPVSLRQRIFMYFQFKFHDHYFRESDINSMISPLVKQEILLHDTKTHIDKVDFFRFLPENILMKVIAQLKTEIFLPGDVIISAGSIGTSMFFIYHGRVAIFTPSGKEVCHLEDGAHFGEIALVLSETRVASVVAVTSSELLVLTRADFLTAIAPYPEFRDHLVTLAADRLNKTMMRSE